MPHAALVVIQEKFSSWSDPQTSINPFVQPALPKRSCGSAFASVSLAVPLLALRLPLLAVSITLIWILELILVAVSDSLLPFSCAYF